jgi:ABC-type dipeptide/oligopeptide/nickel transport system ATPase component
MNPPLLSIENLSLTCEETALLTSISMNIHQGEFVALVGESGSGKTLLARSIISLLPSPSLKITSGSILFEGKNLASLSPKELQSIRGQKIGYIPQFSLSSLNPLMKIDSQLKESPYARETPCDMLRQLGFFNPEYIANLYPHELSGGMRQRVLIAMALIHSPFLLIADEPTTSLDVSLQAEIIELLSELKHRYHMGILFITHDLGIVARAADKVIILQNGCIVETGSTEDIFYHPKSLPASHMIQALSSPTWSTQ